MLKIRLARVGKRGHATFRIVITEHTRPSKSGALEMLGSYDPHTNNVQVDAERVKKYIASGAQVSPTVHNLLVDQKIVEGAKVVARRFPKKEEPKPAEGAAAAPAPEAEAPKTEAPAAAEAPAA